MAQASASQLPYIIPDMVYYSSTGWTGTNIPIGTPSYPVNNVADLISICTSRGMNNIHVKGFLTLDRNLTSTPYNFFGDGDLSVSGVVLHSMDAEGSTFHDMALLGSSPGYLLAWKCFVSGNLSNYFAAAIVGRFFECQIGSISAIPGSEQLQCIRCNAVGGSYLQTTSSGGFLRRGGTVPKSCWTRWSL